jgi:hypothetical protein
MQPQTEFEREFSVWAALAKLAPLQRGQILNNKRAAKDAKIQISRKPSNPPSQLYPPFYCFFKG